MELYNTLIQHFGQENAEKIVKSYDVTIEIIENPKVTVDQLDDLFTGLVSGIALISVSSDGNPQVDQILGGPKERYSKEAYETLWTSLYEVQSMGNLYERELPTNIDETITKGMEIQKRYEEDPEAVLMDIRRKIMSRYNTKPTFE